jgi:hypothetical protein
MLPDFGFPICNDTVLDIDLKLERTL